MNCVERAVCEHLLIPENTLGRFQGHDLRDSSKCEFWSCSRDWLIIQFPQLQTLSTQADWNFPASLLKGRRISHLLNTVCYLIHSSIVAVTHSIILVKKLEQRMSKFLAQGHTGSKIQTLSFFGFAFFVLRNLDHVSLRKVSYGVDEEMWLICKRTSCEPEDD
jgi:hypothetical protein